MNNLKIIQFDYFEVRGFSKSFPGSEQIILL